MGFFITRLDHKKNVKTGPYTVGHICPNRKAMSPFLKKSRRRLEDNEVGNLRDDI